MKIFAQVWTPFWVTALLTAFGYVLSCYYPFPALTYKTEHVIIKYQNESDLKALAEGINTDLEGLSKRMDDIFCKTEEALGACYDIGQGVRARIYLCNTKRKFSRFLRGGQILWFNNVPTIRGYYNVGTQNIFLYTKCIRVQTIAHEITHALFYAYLPKVAKTDHEHLAEAIGRHVVKGVKHETH